MLAAVINFCSNDFRYLEPCIRGVEQVADQILICVADHFFDGSLEQFSLLEACFSAHPECTFIEFAYLRDQIYGSREFSSLTERQRTRQWHNTGRLIGYFYLRPEIQDILFLDADEVADPERFSEWYKTHTPGVYAAIRFASYWYFRSARIRGKELRDSALLVRRRDLHPDLFFDENERKGLYTTLPNPKLKNFLPKEGTPLFHHFSWVKTREEMLLKTKTWGHKTDFNNWEEHIEEEFSRPFNGRDWSGEGEYIEVVPPFDPLHIEVPKPVPMSLEEHLKHLSYFPNVLRIGPQDIYQKDLQERFQL